MFDQSYSASETEYCVFCMQFTIYKESLPLNTFNKTFVNVTKRNNVTKSEILRIEIILNKSSK